MVWGGYLDGAGPSLSLNYLLGWWVNNNFILKARPLDGARETSHLILHFWPLWSQVIAQVQCWLNKWDLTEIVHNFSLPFLVNWKQWWDLWLLYQHIHITFSLSFSFVFFVMDVSVYYILTIISNENGPEIIMWFAMQ